MQSRVSPSRMENLRTARRHLGAVLGDTPLTQIVPLETVERLRRRLSEASVYTMAATLRQFMGLALNAGWIATNQCVGITSLCRRSQGEGFAAVSHEELGEKFFAPLEGVNERHLQLILVTAFTALRIGSVRDLRWEWVDLGQALPSCRLRP